MPVSAQKFLEQLSTVRLLSAEELSTIRGKLGAEQLKADAEQLARELVKAGKLTRYQAAALYQGRGRGLVFGEYVVLDKLGAGGMGQVFKAQHRRMKRMAAIKVLPPHMMKAPQIIQRFYQEVEVAARLNHPNIVQAYDAAEANGLHFLAMEFIDGQDLGSIVAKQGPLSVEQAMNCLRQTAEGLAYAHGQGIIHRDIKPANLLADRQGNVKILDMGLARTVDAMNPRDSQSGEGLTQQGEFMGTVDYMAPEQARDARSADHRADIYSLGCTLYRLLTGEVPFPSDTTVKKLMAHMTAPIPPLRKARPEAPPRLEELYQRMMVKDPDERISSAQEVAATLKELLSSTTEEKSSISVLDDPQQSEEWHSFLQATDAAASSTKLKRKRPEKETAAAPVGTKLKNPRVLAAGGAFLFLLMLIGGWLAWRGGSGEPEVAQAAKAEEPESSAFSSEFAKPPAEAESTAKPTAATPAETTSNPQPQNTTTPSTSTVNTIVEKPASTAPQTAVTPSPLPTGKAIDLLPLIDLKRDVVAGSWEFADPAVLRLNAGSGSQYSRLQLPIEVPRDYVLTCSAKRISGSDGLILGILCGGQQAMVYIAASTGSGLARVDGKASNQNETTVTGNSAPQFKEGQSLELRYAVVGQRILVQVDRITIIDWQGAPERLSLNPPLQVPNTKGIFIATSANTSFEITKVELTPLDDSSSAPATVVGSKPSPVTQPPPESGKNHALFFDGRTAYVALPGLKLPESRVMTMEATVWPGDPHALTGTASGIMGNINSDGTSVDLAKTGINLNMQRRIDGQVVVHQAAGGVTLRPRFRIRVAAVFDIREWRLFVDGKLAVRKPTSGEPTPGHRPFVLASNGTSGGQPQFLFHGTIDEVRISSIARYLENYEPNDRLEPDEHTLALYHFNEGTGTVLGDASGHGHHGKIYDAKWIPAPPADPRPMPAEGSYLTLALGTVDKAIQPDLVKAKTALDKTTLAQRLSVDASDTARSSDERFALLQRALELAVESADRDVIKQILAAHQERFQGSAEDRFVDALGAVSKKPLPASASKSLTALAVDMWYRAYGEDQINLSRRLATAAGVLAKKTSDPALIKSAGDLTKWLTASKAALDAAADAQEKLAGNNSDAAAHLALGQYLCFHKEDWFPGLQHLAKGSDDSLRALAELSLAAGDDLPKILTAGDAWFDSASKATGKTKLQYQSAAIFWYLEAYNRLTGADRSRVATRLTQMGAKNRPMSFTQAQREREVAEWVVNGGGTASYILMNENVEHSTKDVAELPTQPFWLTAFVFSKSPPITEALVDKFIQLKRIERVDFSGCWFPAGQFGRLGRLVTLTSLTTDYGPDDDDLKGIQTFKNLTTLVFTDPNGRKTRLTDSGVVHLAALTNLTVLNLGSSPNVGESVADVVMKLKNLTLLGLKETRLTDAGLKKLQSLNKLTTLYVHRTRITAAGVQEFKRALPNCSVSGP